MDWICWSLQSTEISHWSAMICALKKFPNLLFLTKLIMNHLACGEARMTSALNSNLIMHRCRLQCNHGACPMTMGWHCEKSWLECMSSSARCKLYMSYKLEEHPCFIPGLESQDRPVFAAVWESAWRGGDIRLFLQGWLSYPECILWWLGQDSRHQVWQDA